MYFKAMEEGTLDSFNYPRKGKNIPPPRREFDPNEMEEQEDQYEQDPNDIQLYDENGNPQKFFDENGNEIPFEDVQRMMQDQQMNQQQYGEEMEDDENNDQNQDEYGEEIQQE